VHINSVDVDATPREPQFVHGASECGIVLSSVLSALCDKMLLPKMVSQVQVATHFCHQDLWKGYCGVKREDPTR